MSSLTEVKASITQRRAVEIFLSNGGNKVDAYVRSRRLPVSPNTPDKLTRRRANTLFSSVAVRRLLAEADFQTKLTMERKSIAGLDNVMDKYQITKERILEELAKIAFAQATDVMSWGPDGVLIKDSKDIGDASAAVGEVVQTGGGEQPVGVKVKLLDKQQALLALGREFGMFNQKVEHRGTVAVAAKFIVEGK